MKKIIIFVFVLILLISACSMEEDYTDPIRIITIDNPYNELSVEVMNTNMVLENVGDQMIISIFYIVNNTYHEYYECIVPKGQKLIKVYGDDIGIVIINVGF